MGNGSAFGAAFHELDSGAQMIGSRGRWGILPAILLALTCFILMIPFARIDFDPHHDGYMLAVALGVHDGLRVHTDVFAQYGPITPWLQSLGLFLPFGPALDLRLLNSALIALGLFLLADAGRVVPQAWPVSRSVGWWAAITWFLLADFFLYIPMLPWSSTLCAVLVLLIMTLIARGLRRRDRDQVQLGALNFALAGSLVPLVFFTRINVGVFVIAGLLSLVLFLGLPWTRRNSTLVISAAIGTSLSSMTIFLVLLSQDAWGHYLHQAIFFPFGMHVGQTFPDDRIVGLLRALLEQTPAVLLIGIAVLVQRHTASPKLQLLIGLVAGGGVVAFENRRIMTDPQFDGWFARVTSPNDIFLTGTQPNFNYLVLFVALVAAAVLVLACLAVKWILRTHKLPQLTLRWAFLAVLALALLVQIVPTWDSRHIWWGIPIGLIFLFGVIAAAAPPRARWSHPLLVPLLAICVMAAFSGWNYLRLDRVSASELPILNGMLVNRDLAAGLEEDKRLILSTTHSKDKVVFLVQDGIYSILVPKLSWVDRDFLGWDYSVPIKERLQGDPVIIGQRPWFQETWFPGRSVPPGYEVFGETLRLSVLRPQGKSLRND